MAREDQIYEQPGYPANLHHDVVGECQTAWRGGRPWTVIRELRKGVDNSDGQACAGSLGNHHLECKEPVEGVQYNTAFGDPLFFCEKHALLQFEWDVNLYDSKSSVKVKKQTPEEIAWWQKFMQKGKKKKDKEETEEIDPS